MIQRVRSMAFGLIVAFGAQGAAAQDRPTIVAVNYALQALAQQLVGDEADVVFPVPADVDPSFWRPTIADISMIQSADLILLNGGGFATWVDRVSLPRSKLVNTTAALEDQFIVTESITHSHGDGGEHSHEGLATYTWLDPMFAAAQADVVARALSARGLVAEADIALRLEALQAQLTTLDAQATSTLGPAQGVPIITTHPRYQYFARRYGLNMTALEWEAGAMPSDEDLADLAAMVTEIGAKVLIWEAAPPEAAISAATALGLESVVFPPLVHPAPEGDFDNAFGEAVSALAAAVEAVSTE